jgi:phage tail-like protein
VRQIACVARGAALALLDEAGSTLWIVPTDASAQAETREYDLFQRIDGWTALHMTSDGAGALAIGGMPDASPAHWSMWLFDAEGQWRDGPLTPFSHVPENDARTLRDFALHDDAVWFALDDGVWRLDSSDACIARAADGCLLTPALQSPEPGLERGWLRAELAVDLPAGASIEADYVSTDDDDEAARIASIANEWRLDALARIERIGSTAPSSIAPIHIAGPQRAAQPAGVPLFRTSDRWLWLRLRITTPPGVARTHIDGLRVLYPNRSLERFLPHAYRGGDPATGDFLRRLLGVLEATTQSIDARIASIGAHIDPRTAPDGWLDTLGDWLALPWDDALPAASKRGLLTNAAALLAARGTREGTRLLLESVLGAQAVIRVEDVTVDHPLTGLGGARSPGPAFPVLLAGVPARIARTNRASRLNRTALVCDPDDAADPLRFIVPTLVLTIRASHDAREAIEPVLAPVLTQYVPAGVRVRIRWRPFVGPRMTPLPPDALMVLDAQGPGVLDLDSVLGRTVLATRAPARIGRDGLDVGFRID